MLPSEISIAQSIANVITDTTTYVILVLLTAFLIYFFHLLDFFELPNSYKMILSLVIPMFLWEFVLSFIFGSLGMPLKWGTYSYHFPYFGDIVLTSGVMFSKFLDFVFNFGVFTTFGSPYLTEFIKNVPVNTMVTVSVPEGTGVFELIGVIFSSWFTIFTWLYVSIDSIIDFVFFYVLFSAILAIISENIKNLKLYAFGLATIPVILYSYYVSNPFQEFPKALVGLQEVFYFWNHAPTWDIIVFSITLIFSFLLVMEIIALIIYLFLKGGAVTIQPSWQTKEWEISQHGVAFTYTLAFIIMYFMHNYSYYIMFPFFIFYTYLKKISGVAIETMNSYTEKTEMRNLISGINNDNRQIPIQSVSKTKNSVELIMYIGIIVIIIMLLYNNNII